MNKDECVIARNRTYFALAALGSVAFVAIGVWLLVDDIVAGVLVGIPAIVFFGFTFVEALRGVFDDRPGLIISPDGICCQPPGRSPMSVPWTDIAGISTLSVSGRRFLSIDVRDPEKYLARRTRFERVIAAVSPARPHTVLQIYASTLRIGFDELKARLQQGLEKFGHQD